MSAPDAPRGTPRRAGFARVSILAVPGAALVAALLLVLAVRWAFGPALGADFVNFDDPENFTRNFEFRGLDGAHLSWMLRTAHMGHYQPLSWMSLALDHARGGHGQGGLLDAGPFHATNVALHALTALLVMALATRVLARALPRAAAPALALGAFTAAFAFAVHPLRAESVAWVTERRDVLSAPFFFAALWAWTWRLQRAPARELSLVRAVQAALASLAATALFFASVSLARPGRLEWGALGGTGFLAAFLTWILAVALAASASPRGRAAFALAALAALLSLSSKAWGIVLPVLLLVLDAWPWRRARGREWLALLLEKAPFAALAVVFGALARWAQASQMDTLKSLGEHGLLARATQGLYGLAFYPWRTLVPRELSPIYDLPRALSLAEPRFASAALAVLAATAAAWLARHRVPALLAAWVAFGVTVSPVLGVLQSGPQLVADRYSYLACVPFAILAGGLVARASWSARWRWPAWLAAALLALAALPATRAQVSIWRDSQSLWEHALRVNEASPMANLSLGTVRHLEAGAARDPEEKRRLLDAAAALFQRGLDLEPSPRLWANLALVEGTRAELPGADVARQRALALADSARALELARERGALEPELRMNHAVHLVNAGRSAAALELFEAALRQRPNSVQGWLRYGIALLNVGRPRDALAAFQRTLALEPGNESARAFVQEARAQIERGN